MKTLSEFYKEVAESDALQEEFAVASGEGKAALFAFAKKHDCTASEEEVLAFFEGMATARELSDDDLDSVAGGKVNPTTVITSIISGGIFCAVMSVVVAITEESCNASFQK